ncbi:TonB-dependent receptor [Williamwhitmania taraxaci]|uniref:Iron complex outermembrane recepter protein n=1 Tax=Williamwhitmania taraxaci TaxID=1640674 RepID=A0A1G6HEX1_9BACT|nr:TonB-dependent receptor [Williamwhitmania taraxaci]SDB92792.1 iron complex outermembrane recepter protein [Williamwhitmania taraxaci]
MIKCNLLLILLFPLFLNAQSISGYVKDSENGSPLIGVNVMLEDKGTVSDGNGFFQMENTPAGTRNLTFTCIGYKKQAKTVVLSENSRISLDILMVKDEVRLDEVVVSATRSENRISQIPGRVNLISTERLAMVAGQSIDEYLQLLPGVQVSRSFGIFSTKSSVTMRGLSGNEQARTLVLLDGIPVNKADGGSVNWNLISTADVERIEVMKGPGSALYGGNAMGGIINVVTRKPTKTIQGSLTTEYGTYNTKGLKLNLAGKMRPESNQGFYWAANSFYKQSDGYITQSNADRKANPFVVKSNVDEKALNFMAGYGLSDKLNAEVDFCLYNGLRGTGEKVYQPEGNTTEYLTYQLRTNLNGKVGAVNWNTSLFYIDEHYLKVNEYKKDDYTWYEVTSIRQDFGLLSSANYSMGKSTLTAGFDIRDGRVDASDVYYTSTDKVDNDGKMNFYGLYAQNDISLTDRFKLLVGLRYDVATFYDGAFTIERPSAETVFLTQYEFSDQSAVKWGAFSPRISLQYRPSDRFRIYGGYSRGFRPSVLDDLCRTGRIKGGLKVANPNLKPEYLDNLEVGSDFSPVKNIKLSTSLYYSRGTDFLYYVSTGSSIDMGYGDRPIMIRSNISSVNIYGAEFDVSHSPTAALTMFGNYAYCSAKISDYKPLSSIDPVSLTGKHLTDVPEHSFAAGAFVRSRIVNAGLSCRYTGQMFVNDQNVYDEVVLSNKYPEWFTLDLKLSHEFHRYVNASFTIQNILDKKLYDSKGAVGPGRYITLSVGVKI